MRQYLVANPGTLALFAIPSDKGLRFEMTPVIAWDMPAAPEDSPLAVYLGQPTEKPVARAIRFSNGMVVDERGRTHGDEATWKVVVANEEARATAAAAPKTERVYVPANEPAETVEAIESTGATVVKTPVPPDPELDPNYRHPSGRKPGEPSDGRARRTKAEMQEDAAFEARKAHAIKEAAALAELEALAAADSAAEEASDDDGMELI